MPVLTLRMRLGESAPRTVLFNDTAADARLSHGVVLQISVRVRSVAVAASVGGICDDDTGTAAFRDKICTT